MKEGRSMRQRYSASGEAVKLLSESCPLIGIVHCPSVGEKAPEEDAESSEPATAVQSLFLGLTFCCKLV
jgi:hypothetical protein